MIEQLRTMVKAMEDGNNVRPPETPGLNKVTVVSDDNMAGIEAHIAELNTQDYRLVSTAHRGNHIMLFWEKMPR